MATITLTIYWLCLFTRRRTGHWKNIIKILIVAGWTESLVDLQEDQLIPQYYYVSTSNKHVNKKDGKQMIIDLTTVVFADRTRSKFTIDCCWPLFNFNFNSSKCCC